MKKSKLVYLTPLSEEMPLFQISWQEAANIYTTLQKAYGETLPITPEEAKARAATLAMFKRVLDRTKAPADAAQPTRCACGYVFFGHDAKNPPTREEWIAHFPECLIPMHSGAPEDEIQFWSSRAKGGKKEA